MIRKSAADHCAIVPRRHCAVVPRRHCAVVPRRHCAVVSRRHFTIVSRSRFTIVSRSGPVGMLLLALIAATVLPGCMLTRNMMALRHRDPMAGAPRLRSVGDPQLEELVTHLNENTNRLHSWRANNVKIHANQWSLSGTLAVEKGRRVRLVVSSPLGNEVDMGSNDERFWIWSRRMDPAFVTCKHENLEAARQGLGIPFEPNWLMQALGVAPLPTTGVKMEVDPPVHQARLIEQVVTAHGQPLRRVVLVDLKKGIVLEYSLYSYDGTRVALAKLSGHRHDPSSGVVLPHRVLLDCPQNQMSMTMDLGKVQINPESIPTIVWEMPSMPGYEVANLDAGIKPGRIPIRPENPVHLDSIETAQRYEDELPTDRRRFPASDESAGHFRLLEDPDEAEPDETVSPISREVEDAWDE